LLICIVTVSDRASRGEYEDRSGPEIEKLLRDSLSEATIRRVLVADERDELLRVFSENLDADFVITTGGTGLSARDITPEATIEFCEKRLPGIEETLRAESLKETTSAMLSRGAAGVRDSTIVVNFPGSVRAVRLCTKVLLPAMEHAVRMMRGEGH
jgi:molybdopterin adenylyltransferase